MIHNLYRRSGLPPFLLRLLTSCHKKRAYNNYLLLASFAIVLFIGIYVFVLFLTIYVIELFLTIYVFAQDVSFTRICPSVTTTYWARVAAKYNSK